MIGFAKQRRIGSPHWTTERRIRWFGCFVGIGLILGVGLFVSHLHTEPSRSSPIAAIKHARNRAQRAPVDQVRNGIRLAAQQTEWDREWFKAALAQCTLDDVRKLIGNPAERPERLQDAGWLSNLDWHAAGEAYLLIFERYAELDFDEVVGTVVGESWLNLDSGLRLALLRGGGRRDGAMVMMWIEQNEQLDQRSDQQLLDDPRVNWFRAVVEGWEERHPGESFGWILGRDGWNRAAMLIGSLNAARQAADWPGMAKGINSVLGDAVAESEAGRQLQAVDLALARRWTEVDPVVAVDWAAELPASRRAPVMAQALDHWRELNHVEAVRWLEGERGRLGMDDNTFFQWVCDYRLSGELLVDSAAAVQDPAMRNDMGNFILGRYNRSIVAVGRISENPAFSDEVRGQARARFVELSEKMLKK